MSVVHKKIIDASKDFITLVNRDYVYEFVNSSYCHELGLEESSVVGKSVEEIWGKEKFERKIKAHLDECFAGREAHDIDRFKFGDGFKFIHVSYYPYETDGAITHAMVYSHDVSHIKELESRLIDYEFKDPVTGLFNRKSFDIVLDMELEKARRDEEGGVRAVLLIALRGFSQISARYGYEIGDLILEETGIKIKDTLRATDYVFHFDGRQLAVILTTMKRGTDIAIVAENICGKATFPYHFKGASINIGCNIGAAVFPDDGDTKADLVRFALAAMDEARKSQRPYVIFNKSLHEASQAKARLRADIRRALLEEQFETWYQPIVDASGSLVGAETLIRWKHPELGYVSPKEFMLLAEETGDATMIGRWVLFRVCKNLRRWAEALGERYVSVNLSPREFAGAGIVEYVDWALKSESVKPGRLKLEITEAQFMADVELAISKIDRLAAIGVEVHIDDFGSGFSSLALMKRLPAKVIKVDKGFVGGIVDDPSDRDFLAGMVGMIAGRGKEIVVEGVETEAQAGILRAMGTLCMQGFAFSEPLPPDAFEALLSSGATLSSA